MLPTYPQGTPQAIYLKHCVERSENAIQLLSAEVGMLMLRTLFPEGNVDEMNLILFSTSGIHGTAITLETSEKAFQETGEALEITFIVIKPRQVVMIYGEVKPISQADFDFLKELRLKSSYIFPTIGFTA